MSVDRWIWGCVNGDGTIHSGSGFSVNHLNSPAGRYEITYDKAFSNTPAVVVTENYPSWSDFSSNGGLSLDNAVLVASDNTHCKIKTGSNEGHGDSRNFTFIAIGPA